MTECEKLEYVSEHFLEDAINSINTYGRYWNSSISRSLTDALCQKLAESGLPVFVWEIPPQWEHVFFLKTDLDNATKEKINNIANQRFSLMEQGAIESQLPK